MPTGFHLDAAVDLDVQPLPHSIAHFHFALVAGFGYGRQDGLFLGPSLLGTNMWEISGRVAAGMVGRVSKGDVDAMFTWCPIKRVGDGYERGQEGNAGAMQKSIGWK